jgi:hypothetical protein
MTPVFGNGVLYDAPEDIRSQQLKIMAKGLLKTEHLKGYVELIQREVMPVSLPAYFQHEKALLLVEINYLLK